jgi:trehalose-phosphatase
MALSTQQQQAVNKFASHNGPLIIATDFDGVLAPLVDDPNRSRPLPRSVTALQRLANSRGGLVHVAYVSGRRIDELVQLAKPAPGSHLYGTHGAQTGYIDSTGQLVANHTQLSSHQTETLAAARARAEKLAASADGAWVEVKETSIVLHTRLASDRATALIEPDFRDYVATLDAHAILGHDVTEVSVTDATKGKAITALRAELGATSVAYFGDDVTDETVFSILTEDDLGVKVGPGDTAAAYRVESPTDVAYLLEEIADKVNAGL